MLLKSEDASLKLEFVNYEFPEAGAGSDQFDRNWLLLRCTWVDEEGYTHKDSNACLLAQELAGMNAGLKVLLAGIKDRYDSDFIEPDFTCPPGRREKTSGFPRPSTCPAPWTGTTRRRWTAPSPVRS